ncbi:unnamed protein product [Taenia asiatica]|uniref:Uncharacterized protein n=1 Tax=Taenia asiatica TaxID=60517 RepID=A0A0R3W4D6_TAEAS|nr:unnamed protein product [Taenia asiatica]
MRYWQGIPRLWGGSSSFLPLVSLALLTWNILAVSGLDCTKAKRDWLNYRYKVLTTGAIPASYNQPVCPIPEGASCCDKQMEMDIYAVGESELSTSLANWLVPTAEQMESDSVALDFDPGVWSRQCERLEDRDGGGSGEGGRGDCPKSQVQLVKRFFNCVHVAWVFIDTDPLPPHTYPLRKRMYALTLCTPRMQLRGRCGLQDLVSCRCGYRSRAIYADSPLSREC